MKQTILFPALLTIASVISIFVFHNPFTYFNLFLSAVILCIVLFSKEKIDLDRLKLSALWMLILELATFLLLLFGVDFYRTSIVWMMYAVFVVMDIYVTPQVCRKR